jgi:hypothetical protein
VWNLPLICDHFNRKLTVDFFGMTLTGISSSALGYGHFERPIGIYRMAYSYIGEAAKGKPVLYWGPHTAQSGMYFPIILHAAGGSQGGGIPVPLALST